MSTRFARWLMPVTLCSMVGPAAAELPPTFERSWGSSGSDPGQFDQPRGIAIGDSGYIYATDGVQSRIQVFRPDGSLVFYWGGRGSGPGTFNGTSTVAVAPDKSVYVLDHNSSRIQKFTPRGEFILWWTVTNSISNLAVASDGSVLVVENDNHKILKFSQIGALLTSWGHVADEPGGFFGSMNVATDGRGGVYVSDTVRIHKFTEDGMFLFAWRAFGAEALTATPNGQVYATFGFEAVARKFDNDGTFLLQWGSSGVGPGQFRRASGIALDSTKAIYIVDEDINRISKFVSPVAVQQTHWSDLKRMFRPPSR